jgi:hypothetical protein
MTYITLALLDKVDDALKKRLEDAKSLKDHLIDKAGEDFLLATADRKLEFEGIRPLQLNIQEREKEDLLAVISAADADFSAHAYRIYADPSNTPSLVEDNRVGDGFIVRAGGVYDSPEDNLRLLRAMRGGAKIESVFRRTGEPSAAMSGRIFLARCGPYHPATEEILKPFQAKSGGDAVKAYVISFSVKDGRITVDNTFKPKTVKIQPP